MSARTKKHPIKTRQQPGILYVVDDDGIYAIPKTIAQHYKVDAKHAVSKPANISADEVFAEMDRKIGRPAALLKGLRARENLSQVEFARRINVTQANLSKMENGQRPIGNSIAQRIAQQFDVDHDYFLE